MSPSPHPPLSPPSLFSLAYVYVGHKSIYLPDIGFVKRNCFGCFLVILLLFPFNMGVGWGGWSWGGGSGYVSFTVGFVKLESISNCLYTIQLCFLFGMDVNELTAYWWAHEVFIVSLFCTGINSRLKQIKCVCKARCGNLFLFLQLLQHHGAGDRPTQVRGLRTAALNTR